MIWATILILGLFLLASVLILAALISSFLPFASRVPFVPSPQTVYDRVLKEMDLKSGSLVYDLGCGNAKILIYLARHEPRAKYFGYEKRLFPFWWGKSKIKRLGLQDRVSIYRKNFFKEDLGQATHIFTFLLPMVMDKLLPKLEKELQPGTTLVSLDFPFKNKVAQKTIEVQKKGFGQRIYVYKF